MDHNQKKYYVVATALLLLVSVGCQMAAPPQEPTPQNNPNAPEAINGRSPQTSQLDTNIPTEQKSQDPQSTAERLAELATQVPEVHDATAVVFGKVAIVGIDVGQNLDRSRVGTVKYTVAEALKEDPQGANTVVTADADTLVRLREIAKKIREGEPVEGFTKELSNMVGRLMPQLPKDVQTPAPEGHPEQIS